MTTLTGDAVSDNLRTGAQASNPGASLSAPAESPSLSDQALDIGESDGFNHALMAAPVAAAAGAAGYTALAGGASLLGAGAAAGAAALSAAVPLAVGMASFAAADWAASKATSFVMDNLGVASALGLSRIATDGDQPAVLHHIIAHQHKDMGLWGALAAVAIGVFAVATFGAGLVVVAAAAAVGGLIVGVASTLGQYGSPSGMITSASTNVTMEGIGVARVFDTVTCDQHGPSLLAEGCLTVTANARPIVRLGHRTQCDANVNQHVRTIFVTKRTIVVAHIEDSRSKWLRWLNVVANVALALVGVKAGIEEGINVGEEHVPPESRCTDGCPIDVATGEVVELREDIHLPGLIPITLKRFFANFSPAVGGLGPKWANTWSMNIRVEADAAHFQDDSGCLIRFPATQDEIRARNLQHPHLLLEGDKRGTLRLFDRVRQLYYEFAHLVGERAWISRILDRRGISVAFAYDNNGLRSVTRSNGDALDVESHKGRIHRVSLGGIELARYVYDTQGMLIEAHSFQNGSFFYTYDSRGYMLSWNDTHLTRVSYAYDDKGRATRNYIEGGRFSGEVFYDDALKITTYVNSTGAPIYYHHNGAGLVWKIVDPLGHAWTTQYDLSRQPVAMVDPLGRRRALKYGDWGELLEEARPSGAKTRYAYDAQGALVSRATPGGAQWTFRRDAFGDVVESVNPLGEVTALRRGAQGEVVRVDLPNGAYRSVYYTREGRPGAITDARGFERRLVIDALGRTAQASDAQGHTTRFDYAGGPDNPRGALRRMFLPNGAVLSYEYDSEGQLTKFTDGEGRSTQFRAGLFDFVEEIVDARGGRVRLSYDGRGRLVGVVNARGERFAYEYDPAGRLIRERDFGGLVTEHRYDAAGQRVATLAPDGARTGYLYDSDGRLMEARVYAPGAREPEDVTQYAYDDDGRLIRAANRYGVVEFERDALGRVTLERVNGREIRSQFGKGAMRRARRADEGGEVAFDYDGEGLASAIRIAGHAPLSFARDARGAETSRLSGAGFLLNQEWDSVGLLKRQTAGALSPYEPADARRLLPAVDPIEGAGVRRDYRWDRAFNPVEIEDGRWGTTRFAYDARGQVAEAETDGRLFSQGFGEQFDYDAAGDIALRRALQARAPGVGDALTAEIVEAANWQYAPGGRLTRRGRIAYEYDAAGRVTQKRVEEPGFRTKVWRYGWDGRGRLAQCTTPAGEVWRYGYDALGRRLWKRNVTAANDNSQCGFAYQWDGDVVAAEAPLYADGRIAWERATRWHHEPGTFRPLAREREGRLDYVVTDHLGTPREMLDESGRELTWSASFSLWGERRAAVGLEAANDDRPPGGVALREAQGPGCPIRFPGQWEDEESGLYYNRFRYYDPQAGAYLSPDPIGLEGGLRPQGYVGNPLGWIDPFGLAKCAFVDDNGVLNLKNKYPEGSPEDLALQQHVADWNNQLETNGPMTRQAVTPDMRRAADLAADNARTADPQAYAGKAPGHTPDVGWGGNVEGPINPLNTRVNSYVGGATQAVPTGTTYNSVKLFR